MAQLRRAVNPDLLYNKLKEHIPGIIERYFSKDLLKDRKGNTVNHLPESFSPDRIEKVINDLRRQIALDYNYKEHLPGLMNEIMDIRLRVDNNDMKSCLLQLQEELKARAKHYSSIIRPYYQVADLKEKYDAAKRITVREHLMQDNNKDILDYVNSLITFCTDLCEVEISIALSTLYSDISTSPELQKEINQNN